MVDMDRGWSTLMGRGTRRRRTNAVQVRHLIQQLGELSGEGFDVGLKSRLMHVYGTKGASGGGQPSVLLMMNLADTNRDTGQQQAYNGDWSRRPVFRRLGFPGKRGDNTTVRGWEEGVPMVGDLGLEN